MDKTEKTITAAAAEDSQEESLVLKLSKPYHFEGVEYNEIDLGGLEDTTGADLTAVGRILTKIGVISPTPEMTLDFAQHMAARVSGQKVEFFTGLSSRDSVKLKNLVTGFLYGGDGDN